MDELTMFVYISYSLADCAMLVGIADNGNESFQAISDELAHEYERSSDIEVVWE